MKDKDFAVALHYVFAMMDFKKNKIVNEKAVLENIFHTYNLKFYDLGNFLSDIHLKTRKVGDRLLVNYSIQNVAIEDLLLPLIQDKETIDKVQKEITDIDTDTLWDVLFGVCNLLDSMRLDIDDGGIEEENWYVEPAYDGKMMVSKPYFYNALKKASEEDRYYIGALYAYLVATSSSPVGGLTSVKSFDFVPVLGENDFAVWRVVEPESNLAYEYLINKLDSPGVVRTIVESNRCLTDNNVKTGLKLIKHLFQCMSFEVCDYKSNKPEYKGVLSIPGYNRCNCTLNYCFIGTHFSEGELKHTFVNCTFKDIDFSNKKIEADFLVCQFINCIFTGSDIGYFDCRRFPFLRLRFSNCIDVDKDNEILKGCKFENCTFVSNN